MKEDKKESSKAMGVRMWHSHRVTIVGVPGAWSSTGREQHKNAGWERLQLKGSFSVFVPATKLKMKNAV